MAERETPREDPLGTPPSLSAKKVSENIEEVPRIWEGEGYRRSEILNPINNDYWVGSLKPALVAELHHLPLTRFSIINWVVIINWVQYLGPPVPFSFPDSRDLLEVLGGLPRQRESPKGGSPRVREDPL